ncbi:hypothetical protein EXIGLDRAFT_828319 [Exidia glandulosa HHB12029]|uniref:Arginyl-tRNA--protein transferase 1 n=1 Tax=Exidia glandulosa HHB12029 TaxID=1314781 RepID=A0A165R3H3_EXIGL|nr:hypothetical protein EXIGLDRAFT_828319 [Exidia glandulosa HHB12029]
MDDEPLTIVSYAGPNQGTCGYCSPPGQRSRERTSHTLDLDVDDELTSLGVQAYQKMIDRGWRRSGEYLYKPQMRQSCCPQYTIKLDALQFAPSKSMRKIVHRWNKFVSHGDDKGEASTSSSTAFDLVAAVHASESVHAPNAKHKFVVALEPSTYTDEKFELYCQYQKTVHNDERESRSSFEGFLVESPLHEQVIQYTRERPPHLPATYGSYHMTYRLDDELVAFGVLDILPGCVSSVYFVYKPGLERFSMGKLSALREAVLAREMHAAGARGVKSLYLGFYVHSCAKMRYKGEYAPSFLLDPETYTWHPLETWRTLLEQWHYASISRPERNCAQRETGSEDPAVEQSVLESVRVVNAVRGHSIIVRPLPDSKLWKNSASQQGMRQIVAALGPELAANVIFQ